MPVDEEVNEPPNSEEYEEDDEFDLPHDWLEDGDPFQSNWSFNSNPTPAAAATTCMPLARAENRQPWWRNPG